MSNSTKKKNSPQLVTVPLLSAALLEGGPALSNLCSHRSLVLKGHLTWKLSVAQASSPFPLSSRSDFSSEGDNSKAMGLGKDGY